MVDDGGGEGDSVAVLVEEVELELVVGVEDEGEVVLDDDVLSVTGPIAVVTTEGTEAVICSMVDRSLGEEAFTMWSEGCWQSRKPAELMQQSQCEAEES